MPHVPCPIPTASPRPAPRRLTARLVLALAFLFTATATLAADPPRPRTCLVLSGGGARGITHIGVLRVLEEMRIPVDCIVGTSAGAIIGGVYASGASPDEIEHAIRSADWDLLLSDRPTRAERSIYARELDREHLGGPEVGQQRGSMLLPRAVVSGQALQAFLHELVSPTGRGPFDALPIQYRALATDFESGHLVVLSDGDLATAIRASMSVPGAFAPVEIDGRILVDGGLVRNIGVDIARELGAERLIVVNVGTPLYRREQIDSFLSAAEQMLNILAEQNVGASLAQLHPGDVLIEPQLGGFSATEFARGADHVLEGELATRARELSLAPFAVSPGAYEAWRQRHRVARAPPRYEHVVVDTSALRHVPAASVERLVGPPPLDADATIRRLLATDDFEAISAHLAPSEAGESLLLRPIEKPWGPNYLHGGVVLDSDLSGNSDFTLLLDQRMTWLSHSGLEWRNRASLGHRNSFASELRQPLDALRRFYVAPRAIIDERVRSLYTDGTAIASYRLRDLRGGVDIGALIGDAGEIRVGLETGRSDASRVIGSPLLPDVHEHVTAWRGSLIIDRLDSLDFPRKGYLVAADAQFARLILGGDQRYDRVTLDAQRAFGGERWSLLLAGRVQTAFGGVLPPNQAFSLGGFQNLSGYRADQLLANRVDFLRAVYRHKVASFSAIVPALYAGFSLEGADVSRPLDTSRANRVFGGSMFVAADSALGPIYLGTGIAEGGYVSVYFYLGRP
jgi:NTE family protein